jgi:hypothetical protein
VHLSSLDRLFWALSFFGHCILLGVLLIRNRASAFPVFTTLICVNIVRTIVLFFTLRYGSKGEYFYTYWTLAFVDLALQLAIAYELATHVFQPLGAWAPDVRKSFIALAATSVALAAGLAWLAAPPAKTLRLAIVIRGDLFASALMSEIFVAMIALSVTLGLPWRTHVARIAQGLGLYSLYGIFMDAAHTFFPADNIHRLLSESQIGLYLICLTYWSVTLAMEEPVPRKLPSELHEELRALQERAALVLRSLRTTASTS